MTGQLRDCSNFVTTGAIKDTCRVGDLELVCKKMAKILFFEFDGFVPCESAPFYPVGKRPNIKQIRRSIIMLSQ
jgi:hypothetical protein